MKKSLFLECKYKNLFNIFVHLTFSTAGNSYQEGIIPYSDRTANLPKVASVKTI